MKEAKERITKLEKRIRDLAEQNRKELTDIANDLIIIKAELRDRR